MFTHGFGIEGQLIFHWICEADLDMKVVTLAAGRLFPETYALWAETQRRYGRRIHAIHPSRQALEMLVARRGIEASIGRKRRARPAATCARCVRSIACSKAQRSGSPVRAVTRPRRAGLIAAEENCGLIKFNPVFDWTRETVLPAFEAQGIPINALPAQGSASIGCAPCTRAIAASEPACNGRWWWQQDGHRECGLYLPRRGRCGGASPPRRADAVASPAVPSASGRCGR